MKAKTFWWNFYGAVCALAVIGAFTLGLRLAPQLALLLPAAQDTSPLPPFGEAWDYLARDFYGELPPPNARIHGAIRGLLETLTDPYTVLLEPVAAQQELQALAGEYGDIGVSLWIGVDGQVYLAPYPNGPAARAGLRAHDRLLRVDGASVTDFATLDAVKWALQGEVGTPATLEIFREGGDSAAVYTFIIARETVLHPSLEQRLVAPGVGYLAIRSFTDQTAIEAQAALAALAAQGALEALILDLRGNSGGVVAPLPHLAGLFLSKGQTLYYEVDPQGERAILASGEPRFTGALAVLVDGSTASAAEILAAALQENGRAQLWGARTYGKGSIQSLYPLRDGSTLHITSAVWLTPARQRLDGTGIIPDITLSAEQDALEAALQSMLQ